MRCWPVLLVCPLLSGCLAFGYPSISEVPTITVKEPDVKAFRVTEDASCFGLLVVPTGSVSIAEIPCDKGQIPGYSDWYFAYYTLVWPLHGENTHIETIRLYRRGYETVVIESRPWIEAWGKKCEETVVWKKAETLEARVKAIRDLYYPCKNTHTWVNYQQKNTFIAQEFLLLADSPMVAPEQEETRQLLRKLAQKSVEGKLHELDVPTFRNGQFSP